MGFKEKYANTADKEKPENKDKIILSNDAFAVGEIIEYFADLVERLLMRLR